MGDEKKPAAHAQRPVSSRTTPAIPDEARVWLSFAQASVSGFAAINEIHDDAQIVVDACSVADRMTHEFRRRFDPDYVPEESASLPAPLDF